MPPDPLPTFTFPPLSLDADGNHLPNHTASPETAAEILKMLPEIYASRLRFLPSRRVWSLDVSQAAVGDVPLRIAGCPVLPVSWGRGEVAGAEGAEGEEDALGPTGRVHAEALEGLAEAYPDAEAFCFMIDGSVVVVGGKGAGRGGVKKGGKEKERVVEEEEGEGDKAPVMVAGFTVVRRRNFSVQPLEPSSTPPSPPSSPSGEKAGPTSKPPGTPIHMRNFRYVLGADARQPLSGYLPGNIGLRVRELASGREFLTGATHHGVLGVERFAAEARELERREREEKRRRSSLWEKFVRRVKGVGEVFDDVEHPEKRGLTCHDVGKIEQVWLGDGRGREEVPLGWYECRFDPTVEKLNGTHMRHQLQFPGSYTSDLGLIPCSAEAPGIDYAYPLVWANGSTPKTCSATHKLLSSPPTSVNSNVLPVGTAYIRSSAIDAPKGFTRANLFRDISTGRRGMTLGGPIGVLVADGETRVHVLGFQTLWVGRTPGGLEAAQPRHAWGFWGGWEVPAEVKGGAWEIVCGRAGVRGDGGIVRSSPVQREDVESARQLQEEAERAKGKGKDVAAEISSGSLQAAGKAQQGMHTAVAEGSDIAAQASEALRQKAQTVGKTVQGKVDDMTGSGMEAQSTVEKLAETAKDVGRNFRENAAEAMSQGSREVQGRVEEGKEAVQGTMGEMDSNKDGKKVIEKGLETAKEKSKQGTQVAKEAVQGKADGDAPRNMEDAGSKVQKGAETAKSKTKQGMQVAEKAKDATQTLAQSAKSNVDENVSASKKGETPSHPSGARADSPTQGYATVLRHDLEEVEPEAYREDEPGKITHVKQEAHDISSTEMHDHKDDLDDKKPTGGQATILSAIASAKAAAKGSSKGSCLPTSSAAHVDPSTENDGRDLHAESVAVGSKEGSPEGDESPDGAGETTPASAAAAGSSGSPGKKKKKKSKKGRK